MKGYGTIASIDPAKTPGEKIVTMKNWNVAGQQLCHNSCNLESGKATRS